MIIFSTEDVLRSKIAIKGYKLYVDQDEVLAGFEEYFKETTGMYCQPFIKKYTEEAFWEIITADKDWFINLPVKSDANNLWDYIKHFSPTILTTPGGNIEECKKQKKEWMNRHFGKDIPIIFSNKKYEYAAQNSILIDDMKHNVDPWIEHGGIGILHVNTEDTLNQLREILT